MSLEEENKILRRLLFLNHGHPHLYADDGEMQCSECIAEYGFYDWKRTPANKIEQFIINAKIKKMANQSMDADQKR